MGAQKALYLGLINSIVGRAFEDKSVCSRSVVSTDKRNDTRCPSIRHPQQS